MVKRTIVIEDNLDDLVETCQEEIYEEFKDYLEKNLDIEDFDNFYQNRGCDQVSNIADRNVPIYTSELKDLYYLYGDKFDEAYHNQGIGDGKEDNYKQTAIYCFLYDKTYEKMNEFEKNQCKEFIDYKTELDEEIEDRIEEAELEGIFLDEDKLKEERDQKLKDFIYRDFEHSPTT
jgi:hypothetical protein